MTLMKRLFQIKNWQLFLILCLTTLLISYLSNLRVFNLEVFDNLLGNQMSYEQIENLFNNQKEYLWLNYLILPFILLLKTTFVAFFIHMILVFADYEVSYKDVFKLNLLTSFAFILSSIVQVALLYTTNLEDINIAKVESANFSLALLFDKESTLIPIYSFLSSINPYEFIYIILLIFGLAYLTKEKSKKAIFTSLIIWTLLTGFIVVIQSFLTLNMQ